jgi:hypothetical protein
MKTILVTGMHLVVYPARILKVPRRMEHLKAAIISAGFSRLPPDAE